MGQKAKGFIYLLLSFSIAAVPFFDTHARSHYLSSDLEARLRFAYWWRADADSLFCDDGYTEADATAFLEDKGENEQTVFSYLTQNGYSNTAAAAIMGNLRAESGAFNPRQLEKIDANSNYPGYLSPENFVAYANGAKTYSGGLGLAQWTSAGRVKNLQDFADERGLPVTSLSAQTQFLVKELNDYGITPEVLNSMDLRSATSYVLKTYERPADQSEEVVDTRTGYASNYVSYEGGTVDFSDENYSGAACIPISDAEKAYFDEYEQVSREELLTMLESGGLSHVEALGVIEQYKRVTPDQYSYYNINANVHNGSNSPLYNCVAFTRWYVKEYYNYNLTSGNGNQVVPNILGNRPAHEVPKAGAVVSYNTSISSAGHTAVVLGIDGDKMYLGEASYHNGYIQVREVSASAYTGNGYIYAYPEDMGAS